MKMNIFFFYAKNKFWIAKSFRPVSGNLSLYTKKILFFYCMTHKKFWIAQIFLDSNATLLLGFFSLQPKSTKIHHYCPVVLLYCACGHVSLMFCCTFVLFHCCNVVLLSSSIFTVEWINFNVLHVTFFFYKLVELAGGGSYPV